MNKSTQRLQNFRNDVYQLIGTAKDSTFELMDAVLITRNIYSFAELSLSTVFRRKPKQKLTPGRVTQSFSGLLAVIGTPAKPPKTRGKSTGWKKGKKRN
ncbi:MAG TPA: hypothetical protein DCF68_03945 [Cyanothece sp. UBA12306]|nr:hypothetical protein [Cyanothece sp. UBA12306]